MQGTSIVVDFRHMRCGSCKVAFHDELATTCPVCGLVFDRISSNHVGLAQKLELRREATGVAPCKLAFHDPQNDLPEFVSS
jgi:threonine synthase